MPEQSLKRTQTKTRRLAEDDEEDLKNHCVCQQPYDFEDEASNGVMIECGLAGACENSQQVMTLRLSFGRRAFASEFFLIR